MLDIGWQELLVIGALALIVVGPKDLPGMLRKLGQWTGQLRSMAREFQRSMNEAAREADVANLKELREAKQSFNNMMNADFEQQAKNAQSFLDKPATEDAPEPKVTAKATEAPEPVPAPAAAPKEASAEPASAPKSGEV